MKSKIKSWLKEYALICYFSSASVFILPGLLENGFNGITPLSFSSNFGLAIGLIAFKMKKNSLKVDIEVAFAKKTASEQMDMLYEVAKLEYREKTDKIDAFIKKTEQSDKMLNKMAIHDSNHIWFDLKSIENSKEIEIARVRMPLSFN